MNTAYLFQAVLITFWWFGIVASDYVYSFFRFTGIEKDAFMYFSSPDLICIGFCSALVAYRPSEKLQFFIIGAFSYASLFCIHASLSGQSGWLSSILMIFGTLFNLFLCFGKGLFRNSRTDSLAINLIKTGIQIVFIWSTSLLVIPYLILKASNQELEMIISQWNVAVGLFLLLSLSLFGLWAGYYFPLVGRGTPLPMDATKSLVTSGPYAYIRNPMAFAGIGQGLAIALITWSFPVFVYVCFGFFVWNYHVRKVEEKDLMDKFGQEYLDYQANVKCWVPRFSKYRT